MLERRLGEAGWRLEIVETYDARPVANWPEEVVAALRGGRIDAVLHYSPRSAGATLALIGDSAARLSPFLPFVRYSQYLPAGRRRRRESLTASQPDQEALMTLLGSVESRRGDRKSMKKPSLFPPFCCCGACVAGRLSPRRFPMGLWRVADGTAIIRDQALRGRRCAVRSPPRQSPDRARNRRSAGKSCSICAAHGDVWKRTDFQSRQWQDL